MCAGTSLKEDQAMEIYMHKINLMLSGRYPTSPINELAMKGQSAPLAMKYGVSPKTIRDIWNRRTWAYVTIQLWSLEQPDLGKVLASGPSSFQVAIFVAGMVSDNS
jgi:hypothetical protein